MGLRFSSKDHDGATRNYGTFHQVPRDCSATIDQVVNSSAGICGYLDSDPDVLMRVDNEVFPNSRCGLWARKAISAVEDLPERERIVLTVDTGASETVALLPDVARNLPLIHTSQVGTEYDVANGGVVVRAVSLLNRVAIKPHGRTAYEYFTGQRMKTQLACFGQAVL